MDNYIKKHKKKTEFLFLIILAKETNWDIHNENSLDTKVNIVSIKSLKKLV